MQGLRIYLPYTLLLRKIIEGDEAQEMRLSRREEKRREVLGLQISRRLQ